MQPFNLEEWLQDKSRKVVTRDGRPVRIVCWDAKMECPIVALALNKSNNKELALHYRVDGTYSPLMESDVDLFFANEEKTNKILDELKSYLKNTPKEKVEKDWKEIQDWYNQHCADESNNEEQLTEFEQGIKTWMSEFLLGTEQSVPDEIVKKAAQKVLDLAREEDWRNPVGAYKNGYEQGEQKPSWSEEDEKTHEKLLFLMEEENSISSWEGCYEWLKSLKDRVQLQPKQEWNAQDEAFLGDAIYAAKNIYSENCGQEELIDWLKSLKPNHWKPSEEEMGALLYALGKGGTYNREALTKLYNNLKNL